MKKHYKLSILIPSRNEEWLNRTIKDMLENKTAETEIIIGLDGAWAHFPIEQHEDVTVVYYPESIGQRAMTNQLCKLSQADYVMKADAHTAWDKGFDTKMIEMFEKEGDIIGVPLMKNLHAFDWVCECGYEHYQDQGEKCKKCDKTMTKREKWYAKPSPQSTSYCFDSEPHFQYHNAYKRYQKGDYVETMSLQGSCFMLRRSTYWELNICDEAFGSWGSQGIEVAVKGWTSGRRVLVNKKTWYAHLFRTKQENGFGFPYELSGNQIEGAKKRARALFLFGTWGKQQIRPVSWLLDKFWPVYGWTEEELQEVKKAEGFIPEKEIIYYTDNRLKWAIAKKCRQSIKNAGLPIVSVSHKPCPDFGRNLIYNGEPGREAMFRQILMGLEYSRAKYVFLCEHDVLYDPSHFDFTPPRDDKFYFNENVWKVNYEDGFAITYDNMKQLSGLCANRELLIEYFRGKIEQCERGEFDRHYEPTKNRKAWRSEKPNYDIRHSTNLTPNRWSIDQYRKEPTGWQELIVKI